MGQDFLDIQYSLNIFIERNSMKYRTTIAHSPLAMNKFKEFYVLLIDIDILLLIAKYFYIFVQFYM